MATLMSFKIKSIGTGTSATKLSQQGLVSSLLKSKQHNSIVQLSWKLRVKNLINLGKNTTGLP